MIFVRLFATVVLAVASLQAGQAFAGGGAENLLLVVNQNSEASKTIANNYIRLRGIAPVNVVYLDWQGGTTQASSEDFREKILKPVIKAIESRKLAAQIDYVVYSADFPYRIKFGADFRGEKLAKQFNPTASITGATYLWIHALNKNLGLVMPTVNWYVHPDARENQVTCMDCSGMPTRGFRARQLWTKEGERTTERGKGQTYWLSTMLGVTVERGNTVDEIVRYLTRSSVADATNPNGTFYFMKNKNVRSKARHACFRAVAEQLQAEGARVALLDGEVPAEAKNAVGIMAGTENFSIDANKVSIAPGAICEHFTSSGASFNDRFQTKLSAWLRAGAAGASGTVAEPFAIQAKFPLPSMHLHYRRGASLGEAFYQSVSGPYQLLVVGDPLCQPWAKPPKVEIEGVEPGETVQGVLEVKAKVTPQPGTKVRMAELYVDGRLIARYPHVLPVPLDTAKLAIGSHELRVVAVTDDELEFRGRAIVPFVVAAAADSPEPPAELPDETKAAPVSIDVSPAPMVHSGSSITVTVAGPADAKGIDILQNHRRVAHVKGNKGSVAIDARLLGSGPVPLVAEVAEVAEGGEKPPEAAAEAPPAGVSPAPGSRSRSAPFWLLVR